MRHTLENPDPIYVYALGKGQGLTVRSKRSSICNYVVDAVEACEDVTLFCGITSPHNIPHVREVDLSD